MRRSYTPEDLRALDPCARYSDGGETPVQAVFAAHGVAEATLAEILAWTDAPTMDRLRSDVERLRCIIGRQGAGAGVAA